MSRPTTRRRQIDMSRVRTALVEAELATSAEIVVSIAPFFFGRVSRVAQRAFVRLRIANTKARNGVLLFVVPARRQVVVLADRNACANVDAAAWQNIAARIATAFAAGCGTSGLVEGIGDLARTLAAAFPHSLADINELPDLEREPVPR